MCVLTTVFNKLDVGNSLHIFYITFETRLNGAQSIQWGLSVLMCYGALFSSWIICSWVLRPGLESWPYHLLMVLSLTYCLTSLWLNFPICKIRIKKYYLTVMDEVKWVNTYKVLRVVCAIDTSCHWDLWLSSVYDNVAKIGSVVC